MSLRKFYEREERDCLAVPFLSIKHVTCLFKKGVVLLDLTDLGVSFSNHFVQELSSDRVDNEQQSQLDVTYSNTKAHRKMAIVSC